MPRKSRLHVIAMRVDPVTGGAKPAVTGSHLIVAVPGLDFLAEIQVDEVYPQRAHAPGYLAAFGPLGVRSGPAGRELAALLDVPD